MNQISFSTPENLRLHWNYYLALEKDFETVSRYIEFCPDNLSTYSIEFAHLLLSAASEVDTIAKCVCGILNPNAKRKNIDDYRIIIKAAEESETYGFDPKDGKPAIADEKHKHRLSDLRVHVPRYNNLECVPWETWAKDENPDWWHAYNDVKHERNRYFSKATLKNVLHALAALLAINYFYCRLEITKTRQEDRYQYRGKYVTCHLMPESTFLRFERDFYYNQIAKIVEHINRMSSLPINFDD